MDIIQAAGATPAMAQWFAVKAQHPDSLLFFRMGDFYEMFFEDAEAASAALDIALTARGMHQGEPIRMCGVPVSQMQTYLARLIRRGFRVAIVEQMEDPKLRVGKAPIKRDVVRLVSPGTLTEDFLLESGRTHYLLALAQNAEMLGAAWLDASTGAFETMALRLADLPALLGRLDPAEILAPAELPLGPYGQRRSDAAEPPAPQAARRALAEAFETRTIDAFGTFSDLEAVAAARALAYVKASQAGRLPHLSRPVPQGAQGEMAMDAATRASLELIRTRENEEAGSLLGAIKRTVSAPGTRLLAQWLAAPLTDLAALQARQSGWVALLAARSVMSPLRDSLRSAPDLARALTRLKLVSPGAASPRDLAAVRGALRAGQSARAALAPLSEQSALLGQIHQALDPAPDLADLLQAALADPAPLRLGDAPSIRPGFDGELDGERRLRDDARQVIAAMQTDLATRYQVASLKIRHHAQLGYVIEAPATAVEKLRDNPELVLRQGLASGARFTHPELSALDQRINEAAERAGRREQAVIDFLTRQILAGAKPLADCAAALALLDVLQSAAALAESGRYVCPILSEDQAYRIKAGRHPVVEAALPKEVSFIANHADLSAENRLMLLTGPNMAGKSTYLRQNALLVVLAQAGLPVPAEHAEIGLVDRLFSRVGAADDLARGRSTFMVEMIETAAILHQAGPRSFVIVDEIGRGTGTADGLAIAQAVLEALHGQIRCRAIFATHFHELGSLSDALPRLRPYTMRVKEWRGDVVFMHEVSEGAAGRSWGVHVARLAGVPETVTRRAEFLLRAAEKTTKRGDPLPLFAAAPSEPDIETDDLRVQLAALKLDQLTPRAALDALYDLQAKFCGATPDQQLR